MGNQNNTLEGHLNSFKDQKAQELAAAWIINKRELSKPLSTITTAFPTYSLHDASHSQTIIETIERLLGNNIRKLSATDTFMLLMAAYTHDLGMYLSYKTIEDKWKTKDFAKKINELENHRDPQIAKAAKLLRETQEKSNTTNNSSNGIMLWALEVKNAVTLLTIELFRGEHAKRSEDYLNNDSEFAKLLANINQYGGLRPTLAKIAYLHCEDFNKVFILNKEANGYTGAGDMCHPRFVACMIRLGDLLDFDNNRFNNFALAMVKEVPETSLVHYKKHLSTGDETSLISPNEIRVSFNCLQDDVYREAAKWKKMVEQELFNMHAFWSDIVPKELSGNGRNGFQLPSAKQINIKLKFRGKENPIPDLMSLRFNISSKKTFEMLKGGAIYKDPGRVFLREIVQNAMDATKLQIWKDLRAGSLFPYRLHNSDREIKTIDDIKFSDDIPAEVYDKYPINLSVRYSNEKEVIRVICEDKGTGISEESLIRMTSQVGESRKADKDYEKTVKGMPCILQPTAAFGLGLQTVFYVADEFTIETAYPGESSKRIVFRSSTNGSYCSIEDENIDIPRGTRVIIEIDKDHFWNLFELGDGNNKELVDLMESIEYYIPNKIDKYIQHTFRQTENIPFIYQSQFCEHQSHRANEEFKHIQDEGDYRVSYKLLIRKEDNLPMEWGEKCMVFRIEERRFGSIIEIEYQPWFCTKPFRKSNYRLAFRDVEIDNSFFPIGGMHAHIRWNLFCRETDTLVTISRDKLLPQGEVWCTEVMNGLMPDIIRFTQKPLLDELEKRPADQALKIQYCSLCLIDWQMQKPIIKDHGPLNELQVPVEWAFNNKLEPVLAKELIIASNIIYIDQEELYDKHIVTGQDIICLSQFGDSIPDDFICNRIKLSSDRSIGYYLEKVSNLKPEMVEISNKDMLFYNSSIGYTITYGTSGTQQLIRGKRSKDHNTLIPGFNRYKTIVVNDAPLLGYNPPYHCNCWIYPIIIPFEIGGTIHGEELRRQQEKPREELKCRLKKCIQKIVPNYIVKLIQKHNILKNEHLTEEEIYNTYIQLILDYKFGIEEPSEQKK